MDISAYFCGFPLPTSADDFQPFSPSGATCIESRAPFASTEEWRSVGMHQGAVGKSGGSDISVRLGERRYRGYGWWEGSEGNPYQKHLASGVEIEVAMTWETHLATKDVGWTWTRNP